MANHSSSSSSSSSSFSSLEHLQDPFSIVLKLGGVAPVILQNAILVCRLVTNIVIHVFRYFPHFQCNFDNERSCFLSI
jgi:hypothetical protein